MNKEYFVNTLLVGEELTDFFMVKSPSVKVGANHKTYFDITLCDKTGDINGKKWDVDDVEGSNLAKLKDGDFVKVRASVSEWNAIKQLRITKIRKADPEADGLEMVDYIKAAPEAPQSMFDFIWDKAQDIGDEGLKKVCTVF